MAVHAPPGGRKPDVSVRAGSIRMPRILLLTTDLERGGLPLRVARLVPWLRRGGVEPIIGCLKPPGPLSRELHAQGFAVFSAGARGRLDGFALRRLSGEFRRFDPDLIHASLFHANLAARLVGRLHRPRPIMTSTVTIEIERTWHLWGEALTWSLSDLHVANSRAVAAHLVEDLGFAADRVAVIPNGVDFAALDEARPIDREALGIHPQIRLIVWAGRMDPVKNVEMVIDVVGALAARGPVAAVLLGDGPARPAIERRIRERRLESVIRMALWTDSVAAWLKAADVLLFPSLTEGAPNILLEAIACGCPIVASDIPACRELTGPALPLCHPGDLPGFCRGVEAVFGDISGARAAVHRRRLELQTMHGMESVARAWREVYDRLLR